MCKHSSFSPRNLAATSASADELNFDDLQRAYNACLALSDIKKLGLTPLEAIFSDIAELFPVENSSYGDSASTLGTKPGSLANVTIYFEKLGGDLFESLGAGQDDKTPVWYHPNCLQTIVLIISLGYRHNPSIPRNCDRTTL